MKLPYKPETVSRDAHEAAVQVSRRSVLAFVAAAPLLPLLTAVGAPDRRVDPRLVLQDGWVLRTDDLERIAIA